MFRKLYVCIEHIIMVPEYSWCPMNYYRDDELNNRDDELNNGFVINFIPLSYKGNNKYFNIYIYQALI